MVIKIFEKDFRIKPQKLNIGDKIGVVAPSDPIIEKNIEEIKNSKIKLEKAGFKVEFAQNVFSNTNKYSATAKEKAEDLNEMFKNKDIKMIWCAKGGCNSNSVFEYLDYETIKTNPKIVCGYSDITSITNIIYQKTGLVTFNGTNFKTISTDETDYSYKQIINRFVYGDLSFGNEEEKYLTINGGKAEGILIGGNLSLIRGLTCGKYCVDFQNKILFIEELGVESEPALVSNYLYYMKQNGVFNKIKGLWIGNYEHESKISLEQIVCDVLGDKIKFPIIKSNHFGHIEKKEVIPIGVKCRIDTNNRIKINLMENCVI